MKYWTKSKGIGGQIEKEEDFIVEEIPLPKFFKKFARSSSGVEAIKGPYTLALLKKRGITTKDAIEFIKTKLSTKDIGYAGLKDKFALTSQYITIKGNFGEFETNKITLSKIGHSNKMMQVGELEGNKFTIKLHNAGKGVEKIIDELKSRGMPNYFGAQRFGVYGDNHVIGRLLLKGKHEDALDMINKRGGNYPDISKVDKKFLKFFIHAYQSFIFNRFLDEYISKHAKPFFHEFPIIGCDSELKNDFAGKSLTKILDEEGIVLEDFRIRSLHISCSGSSRKAFVEIRKISYEAGAGKVTLRFELPKGSYATILIREVTKKD